MSWTMTDTLLTRTGKAAKGILGECLILVKDPNYKAT